MLVESKYVQQKGFRFIVAVFPRICSSLQRVAAHVITGTWERFNFIFTMYVFEMGSEYPQYIWVL